MWAILSVFTTMACALLLSLGTRSFNEVGSARWTEPGILHVLLVFAFIAAMSGFHIVLTTATNGVHRAGDDARTLACPNTLAPGMALLRLQGSLRFDMFMIAPLGVAAISFHSIMARSAPSCRARVPRGRSLLSGAQYGVRLERLRYRATPVIAVCSGSIAALIAATCVCASP
jgi:hypothetical protein